MRIAHALAILVLGCTLGCTNKQPAQGADAKAAPAAATPAGGSPALLDPSLAKEKAPDTYRVRLETTKGNVVLELRRAWSPEGADRFYNLVKAGFFERVAVFRDGNLDSTDLTDAGGRFETDALAGAVYRFQITRSGYLPVTYDNVTVRPNETRTLDVILQSAAVDLFHNSGFAVAPLASCPVERLQRYHEHVAMLGFDGPQLMGVLTLSIPETLLPPGSAMTRSTSDLSVPYRLPWTSADSAKAPCSRLSRNSARLMK